MIVRFAVTRYFRAKDLISSDVTLVSSFGISFTRKGFPSKRVACARAEARETGTSSSLYQSDRIFARIRSSSDVGDALRSEERRVVNEDTARSWPSSVR